MNLLTEKDFNELMLKFTYPSDNNVAKALNRYLRLFDKQSERITYDLQKATVFSTMNFLMDVISTNYDADIEKGKESFLKYFNTIFEGVLVSLSNLEIDDIQSVINEDMVFSKSLPLRPRIVENVKEETGLTNKEDILLYLQRDRAKSVRKEFVEQAHNVYLLRIPYEKVPKAMFGSKVPVAVLWENKESFNKGEKPKYCVFQFIVNSLDYSGINGLAGSSYSFASALPLNKNHCPTYTYYYACEKISKYLCDRYGVHSNEITQLIWFKFIRNFIKTSKYTYPVLESALKSCEWYQPLKDFLIASSIKASAIKAEEKEGERLKKLYARSFTPLKTNTKKAIETAQKSVFVKYFKEVELDGTGTGNQKVDYDKFESLQKDFIAVQKILPSMSSKKPTLRFRKLGNHHAIGIFFPAFNCICIDVRETRSFVHEYGHYLDYEKYDKFSLNNDDFLLFCNQYKEMLKQSGTFSSNKLSYYALPSEVFARCFEVYFYTQHKDSKELLSYLNPNDFNSPEYRPILENIKSVNEIMNKIIK